MTRPQLAHRPMRAAGLRSLARHLRAIAFVVLFATLGAGLSACEEEPPPKNQIPEWVPGSLLLHCVDSTEAEVNARVLAGGELELLDDNLLSVVASIGGLETISLQADEVLEPDPTLPMRFSFDFDPLRRVLCNDDLVVVFTASDQKGEQIHASIRPASN